MPGGVVRGYRWRGEADWVVLVHGVGEDLDAWGDLAAVLAGDGYGVVVIDLPGHGLSDDPWEAGRIGEVIEGLVAEVRGAGARRCFVVAVGELAEAAVRARGVDACVVVSPVAPVGATDVTPPMLVMVGGLEPAAVKAADRFFRWTRGWAVMSALGTGAQGTAIFGSEWGGHAREQVIGFLRDYRVAEEG